MAERKSRRKSPPKVDEEAEATGFRKITEHPMFILGMVVGLVLFLLFAIFWLSSFLSEGKLWPF